MKITAAVFRDKTGHASIEPAELEDPRDDEILVRVVATGGLATLFDEHTDAFDAIEPDLTIQGLARLAASAS